MLIQKTAIVNIVNLDFNIPFMLNFIICMLKSLTFGSLRKKISNRFLDILDRRDGDSVTHAMHDVLMSGFAMMFFQDGALLQFQRRLENAIHKNNLRTLFDVESIPKDTQMRELIDEVEPEAIEPLFDDFFRILQRGKRLERYRVLKDYYLITIDASGYFSSNNISCEGCLKKESKKGVVRYEHQILQGALMKPGIKQVIPLAPEEIRNSDGQDKQDCET
jgi:hypothetical protein